MKSGDNTKRASIALRLKEARTMAGLSQGQVARLMDVHRPTISEIEAGNRRVSADELAEMALLYDVSVSWLVGEAPETIASNNPRVQLAARELNKLDTDDLERLLKLISAMRDSSDK